MEEKSNLKKLMQKQNVTKRIIVKECGISYKELNEINGKIKIKVAFKIARFLNVGIKDLFD